MKSLNKVHKEFNLVQNVEQKYEDVLNGQVHITKTLVDNQVFINKQIHKTMVLYATQFYIALSRIMIGLYYTIQHYLQSLHVQD